MLKESEPKYLLDTSALLTLIEDEAGADEVEKILREKKVILPFIVLLEVYYISLTEEGEEIADVAIELPVSAFIPDGYIVNAKDKINAYQKLSSADNLGYLKELREEMIEEYGKMPREVSNLFRVLELKIEAKNAGLTNIKAENMHMTQGKQIVLSMSKRVKPENIMNLLEYNPKWLISGTKLKIPIEDLGLQWFDAIKDNVKKLQKSFSKKK